MCAKLLRSGQPDMMDSETLTKIYLPYFDLAIVFSSHIFSYAGDASSIVKVLQWTLEIVSLEIVDSLVLVDKSALTNILFSKFS